MLLGSKVALITGGARGIGAEIAKKFVEHKAKVLICDTDKDAGLKIVQAIGNDAQFFQMDIGNEGEVADTVAKILSRFNKIEILVNNAGITRDKLLLKMTKEDWDRVINVNLTGTFLVTKAVMKVMMRQRYGKIINIASVIGLIGNAGQANYAASKAGIIGFTKSCAKELASRNITVNAIAPGFIKSQMTDVLPEDIKQYYLNLIPMKKFGTPEDVAQTALFLASDQSSYITGQVICLDGGMVM